MIFYSLYYFSFLSFHFIHTFFFSTLSPPHTLSYLCPHPPSFSFSPSFKSQEHSSTLNLFFSFSFFFSPALSLCFPFFFYLIPEQSSQTQSRWVRWLLSSIFCLFFSFFFFLFFIVMIWLILKLCFWVCILIIWLCLSLEMVERKIVMIVAMRAFLYKCCESTFLSTIFLLIWEDENCGPRRENFLPGFLSSAFSFFCQTVENTVFHPIFIPLFSILTIFIPTKHSVSRTSINLSIFWVSHYFPHEYIASVNIVFWRDSVSDEMPSCFF